MSMNHCKHVLTRTRLLAPAILALAGHALAQDETTGVLRLDISSDTMDPGPGVELFTLDSQGVYFAKTDGAGLTGDIPYSPDDVTAVVLGETQTQQGILLGQVSSWTVDTG